MAQSDRVYLRRVPIREQRVLARLMQLYLYDLSGTIGTGGASGVTLGRYGVFPYRDPNLNHYFSDPARLPYFIECDRQMAGFALINDWSPSGQPIDRALAEFFVLRNFRRQGVGRHAAHLAFTLHAGCWEVAVMNRNAPGLAFWSATLPALPITGLTQIKGGPERAPDRTIFRFECR